MADNINHVTLIRYVGKKPEPLETKAGLVANLSLATNENWQDKHGKPQSHTEWHTVVLWNKLAELAKSADKGSHVEATGYLRTNTWKDKQGVERRRTVVIARAFRILEDQPSPDQMMLPFSEANVVEEG